MARKAKTPKWLSAARVRGAGPEQEKADWLERALGRAGAASKAELARAINESRVRVDGRVVTQPFFSLRPDSRVELDGRVVDVRPRTRVLAFHKPDGVVTAGTDREGQGTVFDALALALPEALRPIAWHAVGRLDRDTTGLLLFTNDERFVAWATAPASHLPKRYVAAVGADVTEAALATLRQGLVLGDGPTRPALAEPRGQRAVALTLTEGRNHQVKRMLGKVGLPVLTLHREAIGTLELDVGLGAVRVLGHDEVVVKLGFTPRGASGH